MRSSILLAFVTGLVLSSATQNSHDEWGVPETNQRVPSDEVKPQKPVDEVVEDYQTVHNREQWEILKTKQQRLRTGKVQLQELQKKLNDKTGFSDPKPDVINAIDNLMSYRPRDPRILDNENHLPLGKKASSRPRSPTSYKSQSGYDFSKQAYGSKPSPLPEGAYGTTEQQNTSNYGKTSSPAITYSPSAGSNGVGEYKPGYYGKTDQASGRHPPQSEASAGRASDKAAVPQVQTGGKTNSPSAGSSSLNSRGEYNSGKAFGGESSPYVVSAVRASNTVPVYQVQTGGKTNSPSAGSPSLNSRGEYNSGKAFGGESSPYVVSAVRASNTVPVYQVQTGGKTNSPSAGSPSLNSRGEYNSGKASDSYPPQTTPISVSTSNKATIVSVQNGANPTKGAADSYYRVPETRVQTGRYPTGKKGPYPESIYLNTPIAYNTRRRYSTAQG